MADRNRSDLDREQRGSSNPNQTERPEDRSTRSNESGMGGSDRNQGSNQDSNQGIGNQSEDRNRENLGSMNERENRSSSIEGDENLNRR